MAVFRHTAEFDMKEFFGEDYLLQGESAKKIYSAIKDLPIIDYHCHLDEKAIKADKTFSDIGELWLSGDHYKWRAMRLCGVSEDYITGNRSFIEKFNKFAEILPSLCGNPVYAWAHMELKQIFGINKPLNRGTADEIWNEANEKLKNLSVRKLLKKFNVEYIATTDDPYSALENHGDIDGVKVRPTFRADSRFNEGVPKAELEKRLDYFVSKGCKIADYGFDFVNENDENLLWLIENCYKRKMILQLHFGTFRNVNSAMFETCGKDSGFDIMRGGIDVDALVKVFDKENVKLGGLPTIVVYPLNDYDLRAVATLTGAFPTVKVGAAWWFNDTLGGIKRQLETVAEYSVLGTQFGMLTDSRSFSSYVRFDYYRRILSSFIGEKVDGCEYDEVAAEKLAKNIAYYNIKEALNG